MNIADNIISLVAPHRCIGCARKGCLLCQPCASAYIITVPSRCYRCHRATTQSQVCDTCHAKTGLRNVWVAAEYQGVTKQLLERMKFHRASAASLDIARIMSSILPLLPAGTIVAHAPTAHARIRQRGFDQSQLIARELAANKGLKYQDIFRRVSTSRQLGASREQRFAQAGAAFGLKKPDLSGTTILIIDDVTTSGATIEALAKLCKQAGAKQIYACLFAQAL